MTESREGTFPKTPSMEPVWGLSQVCRGCHQGCRSQPLVQAQSVATSFDFWMKSLCEPCQAMIM